MGQAEVSYSEYYTVADWENWNDPWELIHGQPYCLSPAPSFRHQDINSQLLIELGIELKKCGKCKAIMPVDWQISEDTVVQPDLIVICKEVSTNRLYFAPSAVFEILSPSTQRKDRTIKFDIYESQRVSYYIIVNPEEETTELYSLDSEGKYEKEEVGPVLQFEFEGCPVELDMRKVW